MIVPGLGDQTDGVAFGLQRLREARTFKYPTLEQALRDLGGQHMEPWIAKT